jgi:hypothetical protein
MFRKASNERVVSLAVVLSTTVRIRPRANAIALDFPKQTHSESFLGLVPDSAFEDSHLDWPSSAIRNKLFHTRKTENVATVR